MEKSGMTRRIDELGRIVIPKEIRKNLKIKDNDQLEINIIDNKIVLSKYEMVKKDSVINTIIHSLKKYFKLNILYTSRDCIIDYALLNKEKITNNVLNEDIINIIEKRKPFISVNSNILIMNSANFYINPIVINGDLFGSIILYGDSDISNKIDECMRFITFFLENYLE